MESSDNNMVVATFVLCLIMLGTSVDVAMAQNDACFNNCIERCFEQDLPKSYCDAGCGCPFPKDMAPPPPR